MSIVAEIRDRNRAENKEISSKKNRCDICESLGREYRKLAVLAKKQADKIADLEGKR